jgi:hypothetical protein
MLGVLPLRRTRAWQSTPDIALLRLLFETSYFVSLASTVKYQAVLLYS